MDAEGKLLELEELEELEEPGIDCDGMLLLGILEDELEDLLGDDGCDGGLADGDDEEELGEEEGMLGIDWLEDCWLLDSQANSTRLTPPSIISFATNRQRMTIILCFPRNSRNFCVCSPGLSLRQLTRLHFFISITPLSTTYGLNCSLTISQAGAAYHRLQGTIAT